MLLRTPRSPYVLGSLLIGLALLLTLNRSYIAEHHPWQYSIEFGAENENFDDSKPGHLQPANVTYNDDASEVFDIARPSPPFKDYDEQTSSNSEVPSSPFSFCDYCGPGDAICQKYGPFNLARSRAYEGPNTRLKRVIAKARSGQKIKIGVLGGSVTKGHGVSFDENWTTQYRNWWRETFPNAQVDLINGAVGGTISSYLETCFGEHIDEDVDLVVIEMGINDQRLEWLAKSYENLLRALLELPKQPAIINLQIMALSFGAITMGGDLHLSVAQYYDTPVISVRNVLLPHILSSSSGDTTAEDYWFHHNRGGDVDLRHMNLHGHRIMADMLGSFTGRVLCESLQRERWETQGGKPHGWDWRPVDGDGLPSEQDSGEYIPRMSMFKAYDRTTTLGPSKPMCMSINTDRHPLVAMESDGWSRWHHPSRDDKPYLRATEPGSRASFKVHTAAVGRVRVTYLRSKDYGLGSVVCWVDSERNKGVRLDGWWNVENRHTASTTDVATELPPGEHLLHCEVLKETKDPGKGTEFRMIAVDAA